MLEKIHDLKRKIDAIKSTVISSAPQKNKDRRIVTLSDAALELSEELEKDASGLLCIVSEMKGAANA